MTIQNDDTEKSNESTCLLTSDEISKLYDEKTHLWYITAKNIDNIFVNDLQNLFDCVNEGDVIMFDMQYVKSVNSINIKTNNLKITGSSTTDFEKGIFSNAELKTAFTCPDGKKAIFIIE